MNYLIGVTLLWSFSFSLIGVYLAGQVDAYFSVLTRIALASLVFLPFLRRRWLRPILAGRDPQRLARQASLLRERVLQGWAQQLRAQVLLPLGWRP